MITFSLIMLGIWFAGIIASIIGAFFIKNDYISATVFDLGAIGIYGSLTIWLVVNIVAMFIKGW